MKSVQCEIKPPNMQTGIFLIKGTAPYCQCAFSAKVKEQIRLKQEAGSSAKKNKAKESKDFQKLYEQAQHISTEGKNGIPASAFRNALISACKLVGFMMTRAKLSIFIEADGLDKDEATPLVYFKKGKPVYQEHHVRLETGVADIRPRPVWMPGWEVELRITFDADQFTIEDIGNLLLRAGRQVGVGEGRPDSRKSNGMGWGLFEIVNA